jgi:hypothetical protein
LRLEQLLNQIILRFWLLQDIFNHIIVWLIVFSEGLFRGFVLVILWPVFILAVHAVLRVFGHFG